MYSLLTIFKELTCPKLIMFELRRVDSDEENMVRLFADDSDCFKCLSSRRNY